MQMVSICVCITYADVRHMDMHDLYAFFSFSAEIRKKVVPDLPHPPRGAAAMKHKMCHSIICVLFYILCLSPAP